jgi:hypothetical protein
MATTLEELEKRVTALEQEMANARGDAAPVPDPKPWWWDIPMLREARAQQAELSAIAAKVFAEMGVTGPPVGHEKLMEMMLAGGVDPNDNAASRELIAMRDE